MIADGVDISRVKAQQEKVIRNAEPVQMPIPYEPEPEPPKPVKNWMSQSELETRSKNVIEFIRMER